MEEFRRQKLKTVLSSKGMVSNMKAFPESLRNLKNEMVGSQTQDFDSLLFMNNNVHL